MVTANRLHTVEEYYFSKKLKEVNAMKAAGASIINLGIGSPDLAPPKSVISAITNSLMDASAHKYQSYQGLPELRSAITDFYQNQYQVALDPNTAVLPLMGSKEGIMHISMAFLNKGDQVLFPNPGYPTYASVTKLVEAEPILYNLTAASHWQPDFEALEALDTSRVKIYVKTTKNKDFVSEVLMFVKGLGKKTNKVSEAVIVSLIGSIDINKISELADTF